MPANNMMLRCYVHNGSITYPRADNRDVSIAMDDQPAEPNRRSPRKPVLLAATIEVAARRSRSRFATCRRKAR